MPKNAGDKLRLVYLIDIFKKYSDEEHSLSVSDIIGMLDELNVSATRQTIYKDIEDLRFLGYDIVQTREPRYGYCLCKREFDLAELKLMVDAVQAANFISGSDCDKLINKLGSMTSLSRAGKLKRQVYSLDRSGASRNGIFAAIDSIHEAIAQNVKIRFRYYDRNEKKELVARHDGEFYLVTPVALIWDDENYYLVAFDAKEQCIKHFRVDKTGDLSLTSEKSDKNDAIDNLDLSEYNKQVFGMYGGKSELVTLNCLNSLAGVIIDRFGENVTFFNKDDSHFEISVRVKLSPNFFSWIAAFGTKIKITAPLYVADQFCSSLENIRALYSQ